MHELRSSCMDRYTHAWRIRWMRIWIWMEILTDNCKDIKVKG